MTTWKKTSVQPELELDPDGQLEGVVADSQKQKQRQQQPARSSQERESQLVEALDVSSQSDEPGLAFLQVVVVASV